MRVPDSGFITPGWPAPFRVRGLQTTKRSPSIDTLGLPTPPCWLEQVHAAQVVEPGPGEQGLRADAAVTGEAGTVLVVRTADCLPVLLCDVSGERVGVAHAGWRGMAAGVLERAVEALGADPGRILAWLGPSIGQAAFEVGPEVRDTFLRSDPGSGFAFQPGRDDRWHADLPALARHRLALVGVTQVTGGGWCTFSDADRFHSYRRAKETGRMATLIWLDPEPGAGER